MDVPFAKNFNDYMAAMAANSPQALVMDWWRRLELTLREYAAALGQVVTRNRAIEQAVPRDDPALAACIGGLRHRRNQVAHDSVYNLSSEDAAAYAREAFSLIGTLARRISNLEKHSR